MQRSAETRAHHLGNGLPCRHRRDHFPIILAIAIPEDLERGHEARELPVDVAISDSFAFGGNSSVVVFAREAGVY